MGVGGSGKERLTRLAAFCAGYKFFQIALSRGYGETQFKEDLKVIIVLLLLLLLMLLFVIIVIVVSVVIIIVVVIVIVIVVVIIIIVVIIASVGLMFFKL